MDRMVEFDSDPALFRSENARDGFHVQMISRASRGQAITETAIFLPLFLLVFFTILWAIQTSVVNERLQSAVRYSGVISSQQDPFTEYSLYDVYSNLGSKTRVTPDPCQTPSTDAITDTGSYPGPASAPYWQPKNGSVQLTCNNGTALQTSMSGGALLKPEIFLHDNAYITAQTTVPQLLSSAMGSATTLQAQANFMHAPDLGTILHCYPELGSAITASLQPQANATPGAAPTPLPTNVPSTPLSVDPSCTN